MEVFPNSSLYDDDKVLEAMLAGDVQLAAPSLSKFETFTKKFRLFDLPFVFEDVDCGRPLPAVGRRPGAEGVDEPPRPEGPRLLAQRHEAAVGASKPLLTPEDAKGLKFRVQPSDVLAGAVRGARRQPAEDGVQRGLRRAADQGRRRSGEHLVQHLRPEVLRGPGRHDRDQPRHHRLPGGHLDRVVWTACRRMCATSSRRSSTRSPTSATPNRPRSTRRTSSTIIEAGGEVRTLDPRAAPGLGRRDEAGLEAVRRRHRCRT